MPRKWRVEYPGAAYPVMSRDDRREDLFLDDVDPLIASVSDADAASYGAVVSDAYASVTSSNALLTVNDLPVHHSQPQERNCRRPGSNVTFNVTAYGAPPLVFQWYFKGTPVGSPATGTNFLRTD